MPVQQLRVCFDAAIAPTVRGVLTARADLFLETDPAAADAVIFGTDDVATINASPLYRSYPAKSVCITESDIPTFRLPGLYAANPRSALTRGRTRTINYFISERDRPNPEIKSLVGQDLEKRYLYSFMGGSNSWTRKRLFRLVKSRADTLIEPTDAYNHWADNPDDAERKMLQRERYARTMASSKFTLCPRGCGLSSYRLFESMSLGVAPVILSDNWRPIEGVDWSFALFVKERHMADLDRLVRSHESEWMARGRAALQTYRAVFQPEVVASLLHRQMSEVLNSYNPAREAIMAAATHARASNREAWWSVQKKLKLLILRAFHVTGTAFPFALNRSLEEQLGIINGRVSRSIETGSADDS